MSTALAASRPPRPLSALSGPLWPVADQMLISATNLLTMVLLGRGISVDEFGRFALVYSLLLLGGSLQKALVTEPHNVIGAGLEPHDYVGYTTGVAVMQLLLAGLGVLLGLAAWGGARAIQSEAAPLLLAMTPAFAAWQLQEFVRRVLYTEQRLIAAFANDIVSYGGQAVLIAALSWQSRLSGSEVLYAMAWSSWAGALLGAWQLRGSLGRHIDLSAFAQNWRLGKWLLGAQIAGEWLSTQLYLFLAAAALGPAAAGILRAVHTLFGPTRILAQVLSLVLPTRLARTLAKSGEDAFRAEFRTAALCAVPLLGGYCLLAALLARPLLILAYGDAYRDQGSVLALYAVATFLGYLTILGEVALRAKRMTRHIFRSELWSLLVVPSSWLMIPVLGIHGVVLGMAFADLALAWLLWRAYREGDRQP